MITKRRVRRALVWAGAALGALGLAGYALSCFALISRGGTASGVMVGRGALVFVWDRPPAASPLRAPPPMPFVSPFGVQGWSAEAASGDWWWAPRLHDPRNRQNQMGLSWEPGLFVIPFWIPLLIGAACGYILLPDGPRPGRCACGYDLRALPRPAEGPLRCPECGASSPRGDG